MVDTAFVPQAHFLRPRAIPVLAWQEVHRVGCRSHSKEFRAADLHLASDCGSSYLANGAAKYDAIRGFFFCWRRNFFNWIGAQGVGLLQFINPAHNPASQQLNTAPVVEMFSHYLR